MSRLVLIAALALLVAGCGGDVAAPEEAQEETGFAVYFLRGEQLAPVFRTTAEADAVPAAAAAALLLGPTPEEREAGFATAVPAGSSFREFTVEDGIAVIDLSREFESGGGTLSMTARLAELTFTLTQFPGLERVRLELDGEPVEVFGGEGLVLDEPLTRARFAELMPLVLVDRPAAGEPVTSPIRVTGTASVFEATVNLRLETADRVLDERFVTATEGAPGRGTFEAEIPFDAEGAATLVAFSRSAADNSEQHVFEVPVRLSR